MEHYGFKKTKALMIQALQEERVQHEPRALQAEKNLLATGDVDAAFVISLLQATTGRQAGSQPHHQVPGIQVWVLKPSVHGRRWYVKAYLLDDLWVISVHASSEGVS